MAQISVNTVPPPYVPPGAENYLSAISTQNQSMGALPFNPMRVEGFNVLANNGITVSGGGNDEIYFSTSGLYNIQWSVQVTNDSTRAHLFYIWGALNGLSLADSASVVTIHSTHGGNKGHMVVALNLYVQVTAGQYFNLVWTADDINIALETIPSPVNPVPNSPAAILTIQKI